MNTSAPRGPVIPLAESATVQATAASTKPIVSNLLPGTVDNQKAFAVRVPVGRDGRVRYVLSATLAASSMASALLSQQDVPDRIAVLYDRLNMIVFRTVNHDTLVGTPITSRLAQESTARNSGSLDDVNREGTTVRTVFWRSVMSGWALAVGVPHRVLYAAQSKSLREVTIVGALLLGVSATIAMLFARRIRSSVTDLVAHAEALSVATDMPARRHTAIIELARLGDALDAAAWLIRERGASLERQVEELRIARATADAGNRAKDDFLALLSHELRTPLNAVYGWASMLRSGQISGDASRRALDAIIRNASAQVQLIDDLLDVARVVSGKTRLDVRSVDLKSVAEDALDALRPAAEAKQIRLQAVFDPRAGPVVGDPARLQQVVWNLLMNAVKFTEKNGRVQVQVQRINSHVEILVSDTGQGIGPDVLPFIFEPFRQADSSSSRRHGGLGLGLALVRHLVELHGGAVAVRSGGEGKGATFIVTLPVAIAEGVDDAVPRVHPTAPVLKSISDGARLDGLRVLVVDDDVDAVDLMSAILTAAGAVVRTCRAAPEALAVMQHWAPDVLVSDIEMPGEDGYSLIRRVRMLDAELGRKTPAVALTA